MKTLSTALIGFLCVTVAGCSWLTGSDAGTSMSSASSSEMTERAVEYEGIVLRTGVDALVSTSHFLRLDFGDVVALETDLISLDQFIDQRVIVSGMETMSPDRYPIVSVTRIELVDEDLPEPESSSSSAESSSVSSETASSAAASSVASALPPPPAPKSSSSAAASVAAASSAGAASSVAAEASDSSAKAKKMSTAAVGDATFTQKYCSTHIGFCVPLHKSWYYTSFGSQSPALWYVETGPEPIENIGDGVITIRLVSGALTAADGSVTVSGDVATGQRAWTGGRHFEISGPANVQSAIQFMTTGLVTAETEVTP